MTNDFDHKVGKIRITNWKSLQNQLNSMAPNVPRNNSQAGFSYARSLFGHLYTAFICPSKALYKSKQRHDSLLFQINWVWLLLFIYLLLRSYKLLCIIRFFGTIWSNSSPSIPGLLIIGSQIECFTTYLCFSLDTWKKCLLHSSNIMNPQ